MIHTLNRTALMSLIFSAPLLLASCNNPSSTSGDVNSPAGSSASKDSAKVEGILVSTPDEYADAVTNAKAGDTIVLANGTWENFEIVFTGKGKEDKPITLRAQTPGQVILTGQSNLKLSGEYLVVSGLLFQNGYTPSSEVISFRTSKTDLAYNSRVTQTVIDDYNQVQRAEVDSWVLIYGRNNRFDHNTLISKRNRGVTLAVRMNTEESRENNHRIDHNYFGPRQVLGSNGGETLRIGTSHYSRSDSNTLVENNYFDRADGEVEIISSKSGNNVLRGNVFFESRGTLTMRHGNDTLVERNVFLGNGVAHTGGLRVINARQTVRDNYLEGLTGTRFGGGLVVMNGVPNGPINRYDPVIGADISGNTLIGIDNIQLGAGSDEERSAVPSDTTFANNLIITKDGADSFTLYDDMSGIDFNGNILDGGVPDAIASGFKKQSVSVTRAENGLLYPAADIGAPRDLTVIAKEDTGASWFKKYEPVIAFDSGETHRVSNGAELLVAASEAGAGDVIALSAGDYTVGKMIAIDKPLSFSGSGSVNIVFERSALFQINDGGSLKLSGLNISGAEAPDNAGNSVIRTSPYSMMVNYRIDISDCKFTDMDINHSFALINAAKGTFADYITIANSQISDLSGAAIKLDSEGDDFGIYNAEYVTITDSSFTNIGQAVLSLYRGGTDESTFGPHFEMTGSTISHAGKNKRNKGKAVLMLHGVQVTDMSSNTISDSAPIVINHTVGEPKTRITGNTFVAMPNIAVTELNSAFENTAIIKENTERSQ